MSEYLLKDITELIVDCPHSTANDEGKGYPLVRTPNIGKGRLVYQGMHRVSEEVYNKRNQRAVPQEDDLIFAREATAGNVALIQKGEKVCLGQRTVLIRPLQNVLDSDFLAYYILSPNTQTSLVHKAIGTTVSHVNMEDIRAYPIPLPPLAEQRRIVSAIEKLLPLIDEYGKKELVINALNSTIGQTAKKAILQEAVQGRLVPQCAADGNARALLDAIRAEKQKSAKSKSSKPLPPIADDEIPFDIPDNWVWVRLGEIVYNNGQKTPDKEFSYIDIGSIDNVHQKLNEKESIIAPENAPSRARKIVKNGDIIYSTVRPYLHNLCIIDKDFEKEPIASTGFAVMACYPQVLNKYLFYYLLSPSFDNYANDTDNSKGVAYPAINDDKLYKGIIPLPPLAEQRRIVSAIEKLLPMCERLGKE